MIAFAPSIYADNSTQPPGIDISTITPDPQKGFDILINFPMDDPVLTI